jgi:RimJ/RimL family protein N-acetyltransferase
MFVEIIVKQHQPISIILAPLTENKGAIRCYEKVGFKHYEAIKTENGNFAYMMRFDCKSR